MMSIGNKSLERDNREKEGEMGSERSTMKGRDYNFRSQ